MTKIKQYFFVFFCFFLQNSLSLAQDYMTLYRENGQNIAIFAYLQQNNQQILVSLLLHSEQEMANTWTSEVLFEGKSLDLETHFRQEKDCKNVYRLLSKMPLRDFTEIVFFEKTKNIRFQIKMPYPIKVAEIKPVYFFDVEQFPIMQYIKPNQEIYLQHTFPQIYAYIFNEKFTAAAPPMSMNYGSSQENLFPQESLLLRRGVDSVFSFSKENHFIFVQHDTTSFDGQAIFVSSEDFPKFTQAENLLNPTLYISENEEYFKNLLSKDAKKTFQNFWLNSAKNDENVALERIKAYYKRVELANKFFSCNKAGWMTDLGMIFVIYGMPESVFYKQEIDNVYAQVWYYDFGTTQFNFVYLGTRMGVPIWQLQRAKSYAKTWSKGVNMWRK